MTQRVHIDRSRYEQAQRCLRSRWYGYHEQGMGIATVRQPLPLAVGGSVHVGLAFLLKEGQRSISRPDSVTWEQIEDYAVADALKDFSQYAKRIELPDAEAAMLKSGAVPPGENMLNDVDEYLYQEQSALVESLVRAYARRRLRPLLEQFEVLEVEREGMWMLSDPSTESQFNGAPELWFMSRPDALLRERESNELYLLSYKTTGAWDIRKARDAEHDMQGMSEGIEIERRLAGWHEIVTAAHIHTDAMKKAGITDAMWKFLKSVDAPPRILAVRYEYMLKGERWKDKELSERLGVEARSQKSHLIRRYEAVSVPMRGSAGYNIGDSCWSWDYIRDDGRESSLAWQNWKSRAVWDAPGGVKAWIDKLDDAAPAMSGEDSTMGLEPRLLGYKCDAQAVGVTREHPLDAVFIPPIHVYRNDDEIRDMVDQMESQERRIAEGVAAVNAATDEGERRHALNAHFPQTRRACEYPTTCSFSRVCYGGEDIKRDPLGSGLYKIRVPNHPQENATKG
jgi:hypothetical protein